MFFKLLFVLLMMQSYGWSHLLNNTISFFVLSAALYYFYKQIANRVFLLLYISNGKTMGVEQACAKSKRELIQINISNETDESDLIGEYSLEATKFYEVEFTEEQYQQYLQKFGELD